MVWEQLNPFFFFEAEILYKSLKVDSLASIPNRNNNAFNVITNRFYKNWI